MKYQRLFKLYKCGVSIRSEQRYGETRVMTIELPNGDVIRHSRSLDSYLQNSFLINNKGESLEEYITESMFRDCYNQLKKQQAREYILTLPKIKQKLFRYYWL